jgi:hypothetical protein
MKRVKLKDMTAEQLVARFLSIALEQYEAIELHNNAKFSRLFDQMTDVMAELMVRPIEERRTLTVLYNHPNPQVRYTAASATKDFAPQEARRVCEIILERQEHPQTLNAGFLIKAVDEGNTDMSWILKRRKRSVVEFSPRI